ncbi:2-isopropylmalate synthase [Microbacterium sp. Root61]|uniref:2-isopropylmalate synthase n=1 Tax=Microbacterium sp. Root61 TaxID=1736570 RepID=UPI0006F45546|nr:2-isopropylmalate synthase [Microbacterium sp. Root61]KRA23629.1 2-isopropylmalate synthase [Microbacterium sp. Root61]
MTATSFGRISSPAGPIPAHSPAWNPQRHSQMPSHRYTSVHARVALPLAGRDWPTHRLTAAPLWVPVDLRDGNQALAEPMDPARKRRFFELMVAMGYKEIEVGYPSASQTDHDFVRLIAESDIAPDDVTIVVFTPARRDLIERTVASIRGIRNPVVIHMYTATAPTWREVVLGQDRAALKDLILAGGRDILALTEDHPGVRFEFSPEVFNLTEPDYVLEVSDAMTTLWDASTDRPVILNLPATVEVATPNIYADQIEYMHKNLARRDSVILSVHPHNDRGTGVACAELALLAGAQRVEGCLLGNGERTGNVDLVTLALNLHAQGVDPMIDFSDIDEIRRTVEDCNRIGVHPRHPYVGDLVHTAFSGTHQDAIKKGFAEHRDRAAAMGVDERLLAWRVPYLPIDPADIGRTYDAVIRVNSQSGKGGIAYLLEAEYGVELPRRAQIDFARHVQRHTDQTGQEVSADILWDLFRQVYLNDDEGGIALIGFETGEERGDKGTTIALSIDGIRYDSTHTGVGPVEAAVSALVERGCDIDILGLHQCSVGTGSDSMALTLVEYRDTRGAHWSAGMDRSVVAASLRAVVMAAAQARKAMPAG